MAAFPGVVQEQGHVKDGWVFELLKQDAIPAEFFPFREQDAIKLLDADKSVFIGGVTVVKFVLNEAGTAPNSGI